MLWIGLGIWTMLLLYVIVDVRRIMARNDLTNAKILGKEAGSVTERGVLINRIALLAVMIGGNWIIWRFGPQIFG